MDRGNLICAVTDDDAATEVVDTGNAIADATGLEAVFATVAEVEVAPSSTVVPAGAGIGWAPFPEGGFHTAQRRAAERGAELLSGLGLDRSSAQVCTGSPAAELNDLARETGAAAIVVGRSEQGALKALATGSVGRWLAVNGSCPVVFARPADALDMSGPVVCGLDPQGDAAQHVAGVAARFAGLLGAPLVLVHVGAAIPVEDGDLLDHQRRTSDDRRAAREELERLAQELDVTVPVTLEVDEGPEVERLAAQAAERHASLLVTGNRGRGPIRRALAGSVSLELAASAGSPVVIVPPGSGSS